MASWFRGRSGTPGDAGNSAAAQGRPLLLIGFDASAGRWQVGQEALDVLRSLRAPLATISVCGRARQGKSFLLNQLLRTFTGVDRPNGFVVSPTHQSCTRGIWMWSAPVTLSGPDGRKCSALLMDCEGVDAVDQGQQHSAQIFSLAMLLSSVFVYNQVGAIDAIAIERLAMVCELAKRIKDRSAGAGTGGSTISSAAAALGQADFSPAFVWLLRDFQLRLEAGGRSISPGEYLEEALAPLRGGDADLANRNQMRATIKSVFPDRDVATLVRPALTEAELQRLDTLPAGALRPEFKKDMDSLTQLLRGKTRPLAVGGALVSGAALAALADAYVSAVNQGAVPQLVTAWQGISRAECAKAAEAADAAHAAAFNAAAEDEAALYESHQAAVATTVAAFRERAMGDAELLSEHEGRLRAGAEERYVTARRRLAASGERLAGELLAAEDGRLRELMSRPDASIDAVEVELRRFLDEYDMRVPTGPAKYKRAAEFLMNTMLGSIKAIVARIIAERDAAAKRGTDEAAAAAQLRAELGRVQDAQRASADAAVQLRGAQQEVARLTGQLETKGHHVAALETQLAQLRQAEAMAAAQQQRLQQELADGRAEATRLTAQLSDAAGLRNELTRLQAAQQEAAKREHELMATATAAQAEATRIAAQLQAAQTAMQQAQTAAAAAQSARDALVSQLDDARAALSAEQQARVQEGQLQGQLEEERRKVTSQMQDIASLTTELAKERTGHDATRSELVAARASLSARSPAAPTPPAVAAAAAAAGVAGNGDAADGLRSSPSAHTRAGRQPARKRQRGAQADDGVEDQEVEDMTGVEAAAAPSAGVDRSIDPDKMTVAALKQWVTDNRLEGEDFFRLSQNSRAKKADWVKHVKGLLGN